MTATDEPVRVCVQECNGKPFALAEVPVLPLDCCDGTHCRRSYSIKPAI